MRYHDWSIWQAVFSLTARLLQKRGLIAKMSLEEKLETYLKEKYANDEKTTKNSEADIPDFRAGFLEIPDGKTGDEWRKTSSMKTTRVEN